MDFWGALQRVALAAGFKGDLQAALLLYGFITARVATAVSLAPFLGGKSSPSQLKVGLGALVAALVGPHVAPVAAVDPLTAVLLLVKEVLLGAVIGFLAQLVFFGIEMAGALLDTQRGMNQINLYTPQLEGPASVLGLLQLQAAIALFFTFDGHLLFLRAITDSFRIVPPSHLPELRAGGLVLAEQVIRASGGLFIVALQLSAPVLVALFLVDVGFGLLNRITAQIPIHSENQTVKAMLSLVLLALVMPILTGQLRQYPQVLFRQITAVTAGFR